MDYQSFITTVEQLAGIPHDQVEDITCLALDTLAERISKDQVENLARMLPKELEKCLHRYDTVVKYHLDEMIRRIQSRMGVDRRTAQRVIYAVLVALRRAVGPKEFADLRAQLSWEFVPLLDAVEAETPPRLEAEESPFIGPLSFDEFLDRVAERAGLDRDRARRATEAVLEVLAMRVTAGQMEDLRPYLPYELRPALDRGLSRSGGRALRLSLNVFLDEITQREGVSREEAAAHARVVLDVLREAVSDKEFGDMIAQLPKEYRTLIEG
jgi:uncharacterized protein (DUF2267 family)